MDGVLAYSHSAKILSVDPNFLLYAENIIEQEPKGFRKGKKAEE